MPNQHISSRAERAALERVKSLSREERQEESQRLWSRVKTAGLGRMTLTDCYAWWHLERLEAEAQRGAIRALVEQGVIRGRRVDQPDDLT